MIGKTLSHYEILSKLGEGGMGEVWEAHDLRLDRAVAIKLIPKHLSADPTARTRFVHEAKAASSIEHANICTIHEIDETPEGETFIVMPRYQGEPLSDLIAAGRLPLGDALHIVEDLAGAMAEAHDHDIIHRDVKPANIIIDQNGRPVLLDFGLAKLSTHTQLTKTGTTLGTLAYMAPEQAAGGEVDGRADLFSLGVILYELVTGVRPFTGDHDAAVLYSIAHHPAPPLATHDASLPSALQLVIDRALAKEPKDRYATLHELKEAIKELRRELQIGSGSRQSNLGRPRTRPRWMAPFAAVLVIAVALAVWKFLPTGSGEAEAADHTLAVVAFRDLTTPDDLNVSAGITELVNIGLIENSPIRVASSEYLQDVRRRLFGDRRGPIEDDQALEVARIAGVTLLLVGRMGQVGDTRFVSWRLVDTKSGKNVGARRIEGNDMAAVADEVIEGVLPLVASECGVEVAATSRPVDEITTESPEAYRHYMAAVLAREWYRPEDALEELQKAVAIDSTFALAYAELARLYWGTIGEFRDFDTSIENIDRAWRLRARLGIKDRLRLEAFRYDMDRQVTRAITTYEEILDRWPDDRQAMHDLNSILFRYWDYSGSIEVSEAGQALYPDDPVLCGPIYFHCLVYTGRAQEALTLTRAFVEQHPDEANAWDELGLRYLAIGFPDSAEVAFRKALALDPDWGDQVLSYCAYHAGDLPRATTILERFLDRDDLRQSRRVSLMIGIGSSVELAGLYWEAGQYETALEVVRAAQQYVSGVEGGVGFDTAMALWLVRIGRPTEALALAEDLARRQDTVRGPWASLRVRARALVALGDLEGARDAARELNANQDGWGALTRALALEAESSIALAENDPDQAMEFLDQRMRQGVGLGGFGDIDVREQLARAHKMAGRPEEAAEVHRDLLRIYGGHALSHYELGVIYDEMGRTTEAKSEFKIFLETWSKADEGLPQLVDARHRLAALN